MTPAVSIITPSLQQGRYLAENIASISGQTYYPIEHIIRDGGSTDETLNVLKSASARVRWTSRPDSGQANAINQGFREASGEILSWLNADDILYPNAVSRAIERLEESAADAVYGRCMFVSDQSKAIGLYRTEPFSYTRLLQRNIIAQPAVFFRRSLLDRFGPLNETLHFAMDYEFWLRCSRSSKFIYVPELFAAYRIHPAAKTANGALRHAVEANRIRIKYGRDAVPAWRLQLAVGRTYLGGLVKSSRAGFALVRATKWRRNRLR